MKRMITQTMKAAALAVSLFGASAVAQAAAITPGQSVTEFITSEEYGILSAPALTTADSLANWAYGSYNDGNVMGNQDQRGWRAVFEVTAPAAGKYGVEVKLRTTTTNWMVGFGASKSLELSERMKDSISVPIWENMVRPTLISTVSERVDTIAEADTINGIPAITETTYSFETGEWETIYVPVELTEGQNYVTFWLCRTYQGIDNLKGPDGSINGVYVQSIKLLPQGSGDVASVLQTATLKLWQQRMYPAMNSEAGANLAADYAALHAAYGAATDYSSLDVSKVQAGIDAVVAREADLRNGQGAIVDGDSAIFALPYYHNLLGGSISENERGEYPDAPMVFEYTNGKTLVYKFTTTVDGTFYPECYFGTQLSTKAHINVYAADSTTKMFPTWVLDPNTSDWQVYKMFSSPNTAKFEAKAGDTFYFTLYFENYVNVRGLYMRQVIQTGKSYAELEEIAAKGEDVFAKYQEGSDGFYAIGGDLSLIAPLEDALAMASDLAEDSPIADITAAYYALEEAIGKIETLPTINTIPTTEANPFDISLGEFTYWRMEGGGNIGYAYGNGQVIYTVYNKVDCNYNIEFTCSNQATDLSQIGFRVEVINEKGDTLRLDPQVVDITGAGGWALWDDPNANYTVSLPIPAGKVYVYVYGVMAASNNFVGNMNKFNFYEVPGSEGAGSKALDAAIAGVDVIEVAPTDTRVYTIEGIYVGNNTSLLRPGFYIVNGKKAVIK